MIPRPRNAELFIGVVARMGVDTRGMAEKVQSILESYDYDTAEIKLTGAISEFENFASLPVRTTEDRYQSMITACDNVRSVTKKMDIMARLGISQIHDTRPNADGQIPFERRAYVINQLKREEESTLLRSVYGEHYIQISFHADPSTRELQLANRIAHSHPERPRAENWSTQAKILMELDESEEEKPSGQRLRDVFPLSDVVIDSTSEEETQRQLERFFRALFGDFRVTPTHEEYGMQLANTAALRSADLSRQVGAALLNSRSEIKALGCNEVPKTGGGTYWEGDENDSREFRLHKDSNDERKREILLDLGTRMAAAGILSSEFKDPSHLSRSLLDRSDEIIRGSQLMDSLEYGRTVHAEMNAITDAARNGHALRDCTLFCNTFPCHNCAKHIVAAGIVQVVYLRPYPKSYAKQLFSDSIVIDSPSNPSEKVVFRQFIGICGSFFERVFFKSRWKGSDGAVPPFKKEDASFIRRTPIPSYVEAEEIMAIELKDILINAQLTLKVQSELDLA